MLAAAAALLFSAIVPVDSEAWTPSFEPYEAHATGSWPESVAVGDVTGDGRNDVVLTTSFYFDDANDFKLFVFPQLGDGGLGPPTKLPTSGLYGDQMGVAVGDLDGDRALDVAVATASGVDAFHQRGGGLSGPERVAGSPASARHVLIADMNRDGRNDLVVNSDEGIVVLTRGSAGYVASTISASGVRELERGRLNGDPLPDLAGIAGNELRLYEQRPSGSYGVRSLGLSADWPPDGLAIADVHRRDGRADVVVSRGGNRPASKLEVYEQSTPRGIVGTPISYPSYDIPEPVAAADMTGDARADVVTLHGGWLRAGLYPQLPSGVLNAEQLFELPYASRYNPKGLALGDVNCDGRRDIVVADYNSGLVVLRHTPSDPAVVGGACEPTTPVPSEPSPGRPGGTTGGVPPAGRAATKRSGAPRGPALRLIRRWRRGDRHVRVRLACDRPCLAFARGVVTLGPRAAGGSPPRAGRLRLLPVLRRLRARTPVTLRLRIPARTRRAALAGLAQGRLPTARILLTATDDNGNASVRRIRVPLRR